MSKEAMKQALDALKKVSARRVIMGSTGDYKAGQIDALAALYEDVAPTIAVLEEALAKQEHCDCKDPSQCWEPCGDLGKSEEHAKVYQQEQGKPVAFVIDRFQGQNTGSTMAEPQVIWIGNVKIGDKLYTTPQQRTWVGLTDEEKEDCLFSKSGLVMDYEDVVNAVEAKIKELNT